MTDWGIRHQTAKTREKIGTGTHMGSGTERTPSLAPFWHPILVFWKVIVHCALEGDWGCPGYAFCSPAGSRWQAKQCQRSGPVRKSWEEQQGEGRTVGRDSSYLGTGSASPAASDTGRKIASLWSGKAGGPDGSTENRTNRRLRSTPSIVITNV